MTDAPDLNAATAEAAAADWRQALPEDLFAPGRDESGRETQIPLKRHPALAKYASVGEALKALAHAQRLLGRRAEAEPSLLAQAAQAPSRPEDYRLPELELPEEFRVDEALRAAYLAKAHELGLSDAQAGGLYAWFLPLNVEGLKTHRERLAGERTQRRHAELAGLRQIHGDETPAVLEAARKAALALGGRRLMEALEATGAADDACVLQAFARMAPLVSEPGLRKGAGAAPGMTPQRLREMMRDPRYHDPSRRDAEYVRQVQQGFEALYPGETAPSLRVS